MIKTTLKTPFTEQLGIRFPLVIAPMFLVSDRALALAGIESGVCSALPSLNFREKGAFKRVLTELNNAAENNNGTYAVNLIVQSSNTEYEEHLKVCVEQKVPLYVTSLGKPDKVINAAHEYGATVLCDVTNMTHAAISAACGCDGFVTVGQGAGGHAGPHPLQVLIPALRKKYPDKLILGAGGIANGAGIVSVLALGADGVYMGTRFIASTEAAVGANYKNEIVDAGMADIVMTERLSGTPCSVINTPSVIKKGTRLTGFEKWMLSRPVLRKTIKKRFGDHGIRQLKDGAEPTREKAVWSAGKTVALIDSVKSCKEIVDQLEDETLKIINGLNAMK